MSRPSKELFVTRGDCFDLDLTYRAAGDPVNLTGFSAELAIEWKGGVASSYSGVDGLTWASDIVTTAGTLTPLSGRIQFHLEPEVTLRMPPAGFAIYQVRLTSEDGHKSTILGGKLRLYRDLFNGD